MKRIIAFISFLAMTTVAIAQGQTIKGVVRDSKGEPVIGAAVMPESNKTVGVITDEKGAYTISIPGGDGQKLVFACYGYQELTVPVNRRAIIDVVMEDDLEQLDEAVVVGYGAMRRSDLTGSVASVKIDEDNAIRSSTLDQLLEGRAAGVQVLSNSGSPDAAVTIRIRGISTFTGASDPLYVVDGTVISGSAQEVGTMTIGSAANANDSSNGLTGINPQDIASIEILKDASATAIFGSRGANGVVLITTKQAQRDIPVIRFNFGLTVSQRMNKIEMLGYDEWVDMLVEGYNDTSYYNTYYSDPDTRQIRTREAVDWQDYVNRTSVSQRYFLSVAGRPKGYNYLFSLGYNRTEGIVKSTDSDNISARLNLKKDISKSFRMGFNAALGYTYANIQTGSVLSGNNTTRSSLFRSVLRSRPMILTTKEEDDDEDAVSTVDDISYSPMRFLNNSTNISERFRVIPSLFAEYDILDWLQFKSTLGGDVQTNDRSKSRTAILSAGNGNIAGVGAGQRWNINWDNTLTANRQWRGHSLNLTLGQSMSRNVSSAQSISGSYLLQTNARELALNTADENHTNYESFYISESSLMSFFGRGIYNYKDRYVLTSTLRFDGSSKFQGRNKWGIFPSFAFAWRLVKEPWFHIPAVSNAKLRLGWGRVGNQAIGSYQTRNTFSAGSRGNHFSESETEAVFYPSNIANPDLKWESSDQVNTGLDLSLWKGRFTLTVDAYVKDTKDLLQNKILPFSSGFSTMSVNDGTIRNSGLEFTLDTTPLKIGKFEWALGGNISFNRNKILDVGASGDDGELYMSKHAASPVKCKYFYGSPLQSVGDLNPINIFIEGQSMGLFYGYATDGIVQEGETGVWTDGMTKGPGDYKYVDMDGDGLLTPADRTVIGNPMPLFSYGFNTSFSWKRLSLSADFSGVYGNDLYNLNNVQDFELSIAHNARADRYRGAWRADAPSNKFPAVKIVQHDTLLSDVYVEDGSYFRISNISLSYALPIKKTSKVLHGLAFTLSVGNVYVWTRYSGFSPMNNPFGSSVTRMGVDLNSGAVPRTYNFDIKFTF